MIILLNVRKVSKSSTYFTIIVSLRFKAIGQGKCCRIQVQKWCVQTQNTHFIPIIKYSYGKSISWRSSGSPHLPLHVWNEPTTKYSQKLHGGSASNKHYKDSNFVEELKSWNLTKKKFRDHIMSGRRNNRSLPPLGGSTLVSTKDVNVTLCT